MTPAEHYREAERLAAAAVTPHWLGDGVNPTLVALAQVHATLALVPEGRAIIAAEATP